MNSLHLNRLRNANVLRAEKWLQGKEPPGPTFAATELAGETCEACNEVKKLVRGTLGILGGKTDTTDLAEELADVVICVDLLAMQYGIDLSEAVIKKFNKTSDKHGFSTKL